MSIEEASPSPIRPALETLRELMGGQFMEKLAVAIHDATRDVQVLSKKSSIVITIELAPLSSKNVTEPVITAERIHQRGEPAMSAGSRVMGRATCGRDARSSNGEGTAPGVRDCPHMRAVPGIPMAAKLPRGSRRPAPGFSPN